MLKSLTIENYALIDSLRLDLGKGLNIITGETGAGKSILLGALSLLSGMKGDATVLGTKERNCIVEGLFDLEGYGLEEFFEQNDIDYESLTTIRRVIAPGGKSRAYVNDLPVQQAVLSELAYNLIDIHSQHRNLLLGKESFRIAILDSLAGHKNLLSEYSSLYKAFKHKERELAQLRDEAALSGQEEEYLRHQLGQLQATALREGEQEELEAELKILSNTVQIGEALTFSADGLDSEILPKIKEIHHALQRIGSVYNTAEINERLHGSLAELKDIFQILSTSLQKIEADPRRQEFVEQRLSVIYSLEHRYRVDSEAELLALQADFERRLSLISSSQEVIAESEKELAEICAGAEKIAAKISKNRNGAAKELKRSVEKTIAGLGMSHGSLDIVIEPTQEFTPSGKDSVALLFSANEKVAPQPVERVASGGEVSRLMLALKALVAKNTKLPTIIFDEIDAGVSGRIADAVGEIIVSLAEAMQVINITHLPQVASKGETHFRVYKEASTTKIELLSPQQRIEEIAKMLSGSAITDAARAQATILIGNR